MILWRIVNVECGCGFTTMDNARPACVRGDEDDVTMYSAQYCFSNRDVDDADVGCVEHAKRVGLMRVPRPF